MKYKMNYLGLDCQEWEELDLAINEVQNDSLTNPAFRARIEENFRKSLEEKDVDYYYSYIKAQTLGPDHSAFYTRTKEYQAFDVVVTFDTECRYGGLAYFFWMSGKRYAVLVYDAFCLIGLPELANLYQDYLETTELKLDELDELSDKYKSEKDKAYHERFSFRPFDKQYRKLRVEADLEQVITSFAKKNILEKNGVVSNQESGSLDDLGSLESVKPEEPFEKLYDRVLEKSGGPESEAFSELPEAIQILDVILTFDMEVQNDGVLCFLGDYGHEYAGLVADAFRRAGLESFAALYESFLKKKNITEDWIAELSSEFDSLDLDTVPDSFDEFDDAYMELRDAEDLEEKLLSFAEKHNLGSNKEVIDNE